MSIKVSEEVNRKRLPRNTTVQPSTPYSDSETDRQTTISCQ